MRNGRPIYEVWSLETMFFTFNDDTFHSIAEAEAFLTRDRYVYRTDIACDVHRASENISLCSLSLVHRWAYAVFEAMWWNCDVNMMWGCHYPVVLPSMKLLTVRRTLYFGDWILLLWNNKIIARN